MKAPFLKTLALLISIMITAPVGETIAAEQATPRAALKTALEALEQDKTREALEAAHKSMLMLTQKDKFHIRMSKLVESKASGWGVYTERKNNVYKKGEKVLVYVEPGAFKYERASDGRFNFGFTVDFLLVQADGNILGGQKNFGQFPFTSHRPNTEIFLDLTFTLTGVPEGRYILAITVHDMVSNEHKDIEVPVTFTDN